MYITGRYSIPRRFRNRASALPRPTAMPALSSMKNSRKYNTLLRSPAWISSLFSMPPFMGFAIRCLLPAMCHSWPVWTLAIFM